MTNITNISAQSTKLVCRPERAAMPDDVKRSMDDWRLGGCWSAVPSNYRVWHLMLAAEELDRLAEEYGISVINDPRIADDGWLDGMKVLRVDVATRSGELLTLEWCDANQGFMKCFGHGGTATLSERDLA